MAAEDGKLETRSVLSVIESKFGNRKKEGDRLSPDEWVRLFDVVREMNEPRGWRTAAAEWANKSLLDGKGPLESQRHFSASCWTAPHAVSCPRGHVGQACPRASTRAQLNPGV